MKREADEIAQKLGRKIAKNVRKMSDEEAEKLLPELKRMLIFFDKNYDDYHPEPSCTTQVDDRGGPSDERGTISGG